MDFTLELEKATAIKRTYFPKLRINLLLSEPLGVAPRQDKAVKTEISKKIIGSWDKG